jgi:hypothetical protein
LKINAHFTGRPDHREKHRVVTIGKTGFRGIKQAVGVLVNSLQILFP